MKTKTWHIIPNFYQPFWDPDKQAVIWDQGESQTLELPDYISTTKQAEEFLKVSTLREMGTEYVDWIIKEG